MKNIPVFILEVIVVVLVVMVGLSGRKILFLQGPFSATVSLGIIGMLFCIMSVGKFISSAPANPFTILGYAFGTIAMLIFLAQIFKWNLPIINNSESALIVIGVLIIAKSVIARFSHLIIQ